MKIAIASLVLGTALIAAPAAAEVVHQTSVVHDGKTMSVSYEPRLKTSTRQAGLGPRASAQCLWSTRVAVERSVVDASGRRIAALTRVIGEDKAGSGMHVGHCRHIDAKRMTAFGGDTDKLRGFVAAAAEQDAQGLRTELASLDGLRHTAAAR